MDKKDTELDRLLDKLTELRKELQARDYKDADRPKLQHCTQLLKEYGIKCENSIGKSTTDSTSIAKLAFVCHEIIKVLGNRAPDDSLMFINSFCSMLSK